MKRLSLLICSLFFSFIISSSFATTCPSVKKINSALEKFKVYSNGGDKEKGTNFLKGNIKDKNKNFFYYNRVKEFKGAYYQKKTEAIKKASLTCMYTLNNRNTYFDLKLRDVDANAVDTASFNDNWDGFYGHGLYSCENKTKKINENNCAFMLKSK